MDNPKRRKFTFNVKKNFLSWLTGAIFSLLFFSLTPWLLAYYGYIDLKLPSRFDFEKVNKEIQNNLGEDYLYSAIEIDHFRESGSKTILVYANKNNYYEMQENSDGIILVLDKANGEYKISYKFQPQVDYSGWSDWEDWGLYLWKPEFRDLDNDCKQEIITRWSQIGANQLSRFFIIFKENNGAIKILTIDELDNEEELEDGNHLPYINASISNRFNEREKFQVRHHEHIDFNEDDLLMVNYIMDNECRACNHKWRTDTYSLYKDELEKVNTFYSQNNEELENMKNKQPTKNKEN